MPMHAILTVLDSNHPKFKQAVDDIDDIVFYEGSYRTIIMPDRTSPLFSYLYDCWLSPRNENIIYNVNIGQVPEVIKTMEKDIELLLAGKLSGDYLNIKVNGSFPTEQCDSNGDLTLVREIKEAIAMLQTLDSNEQTLAILWQ